MHKYVLHAAGLLLALMASLPGQAEEPPAQRAGNPWSDMDYGPYMTHSFAAVRPQGNIAYKGLKIKLNDSGAAVLFDTDLLRYAAGWTECDLDWRSVVYDGSHQTHPSILGEPTFANPQLPGWAHGAKFEDPRELPYGPLPHDWAHWRGLYLHGEQVVLSYTVGDAAVLESPALLSDRQISALSRRMNIGRSSHDLTLQICTDASEEAQLISLDKLRPADKALPVSRILAVFGALDAGKEKSPQREPESAPATITAVACAAERDGPQFDISDPHHIRLKIPAASTPLRLTLLICSGPPERLGDFAAVARRTTPANDLAPLTRGGPARWQEPVKTQGKLGTGDGPLLSDEIALPRENPWHSWMRPGGFDFFPGKPRAAVCTWSGDVWLVDGLDERLEQLTWRRIATGLFQPLGLKIVAGKIYVGCRDQITRLHDLNGDDEIDFYENFNNDHQVTEHFHEFAMDLQTDDQGNFYYAKSARHALPPVVPQHGTLLKVAADGSRTEIVCNGFRAANGVGIGPRGVLATSDQEGHWTPANRINLVRPGGFYGNKWSFLRGEPPTAYDPPVVWLPKEVDRSPAEQLWVPQGAWGPLEGKMLHTSYGTGWLWHVMHEEVDGVSQGGIVRLPVKFPTGIMRGRFNPHDGHLYLCGLVGWSSSCAVDGGFYRVRYTGKSLHLPTGLKITGKGVAITFSEKLDPKTAADPDNYGVQQWNYLWSANYGSPDYSALQPRRQGRDEVEVHDASLSADGKTVFLELPSVRPVMQMQIRYNLRSADGAGLKDSLWLTINRVPKRKD